MGSGEPELAIDESRPWQRYRFSKSLREQVKLLARHGMFRAGTYVLTRLERKAEE